MRRLVLLALAALAWAVPATAAQRVLLAPAGAASGTQEALRPLRRAAEAKGSVRVIVGLRVSFAAEGQLPERQRALQRSEIAGAAVAVRARFSAAATRAPQGMRGYSALPFMAMQVTPAELDRLASDPAVISIAEDRPTALNLAESTPLVRAPEAWAMGYTGLGQTIAIIDTGVDKTHPFLAGKVVSEACYSQGFCPGGQPSSTAPGSGMPCPAASCAHGTHVAGIAAGKGSSFSGVARDAKLIAIQVFSPAANGSISAWTSDILAGLNRAYELRGSYNIAAVNLSLGGGRYTASCDSANLATAAAIANLRSAGIATVVASGNSGWTDSLSWPACISGAVSVGSVSDSASTNCSGQPVGPDKVACYSNTAPFLSLLAPGSQITSSVPGGGFQSWNGTSMASPHVAGAWAVLKQRLPTASVPDILSRLQGSGTMIADDRSPAIVKPRIDIAAALAGSFVLTYTKAGPGEGAVSIATSTGTTVCPTSCSVNVIAGSQVTVTAQPGGGGSLAGWMGACTGSGSCSFPVRAPTALTAVFNVPTLYALACTVSGRGSISVTASDGSTSICNASGSNRYRAGTTVKLTALPARGGSFTGWAGACSGKQACSLTMSTARAVRASFSGP